MCRKEGQVLCYPKLFLQLSDELHIPIDRGEAEAQKLICSFQIDTASKLLGQSFQYDLTWESNPLRSLMLPLRGSISGEDRSNHKPQPVQT